ncbi:hypothetical protein OQA88_11118 [Cercophora sp. LCS_1]
MTGKLEDERMRPWIHAILQGFDDFIQLSQNHHANLRYRAMVEAIANVRSELTTEFLVQVTQKRDDAIARCREILKRLGNKEHRMKKLGEYTVIMAKKQAVTQEPEDVVP